MRERRATAAQDLALGKPKTIEAYRELVGYIRALDEVETEIGNLIGQSKSPFVER